MYKTYTHTLSRISSIRARHRALLCMSVRVRSLILYHKKICHTFKIIYEQRRSRSKALNHHELDYSAFKNQNS